MGAAITHISGEKAAVLQLARLETEAKREWEARLAHEVDDHYVFLL